MKANKPPEVQPPPYKMPATWQLPSKQSVLIAIWGALQPTLIIVLDNLDGHGNELLRLIMLEILFDLNHLIYALRDLIDV